MARRSMASISNRSSFTTAYARLNGKRNAVKAATLNGCSPPEKPDIVASHAGIAKPLTMPSSTIPRRLRTRRDGLVAYAWMLDTIKPAPASPSAVMQKLCTREYVCASYRKIWYTPMSAKSAT